MGLKTSLVLMIAFIVLGTFALFDPLHTKQKAELSRDQESRVFWLKGKLLEQMNIKAGTTAVELVCAKAEGCPFDGTGDWKLAKPVRDQADPASVGALAGGILNLLQTEKIPLEAGVDPKEFGFDTPVATLEFRLKGEAAPYSLKVGSAKPVGPNVYVQTSSSPNTVFMVANYFPAMMAKDLFHWRNKRVFPEITGDMVNRIAWKNKSGVEFVASKVGPAWSLDSPVKVPANSMMLEGLLSTLVYLDARGVFSEDRNSAEAKKAVAGKPQWELRFQTKEGNWSHASLYPNPKSPKGTVEYLLLNPREPRLLVADGAVVERFNKPLNEYRERRVVADSELTGLTEISLRFPKEKKEIVLKNEKETWVYASGEKPAEALSRYRVDSFLRAVTGLEASTFVKGDSEFAKNPADLEVEFRAGERVLRKMRFAIRARKSVITEGNAVGELAEIDGPFLKLLPIRMSDLYESTNKQVVTTPAPEAKEEQDGEHSHAGHAH